MVDTTLVLPAHNEEESIPYIGIFPEEVQVLVVNNCSTNGTAAEASRRGFTILDEPNKGKGNALRSAFQRIETPKVIVSDADLTYPTELAVPLIREALNIYDAIFCYRKWKAKGSMSFLHRIGNELLTTWAILLEHPRQPRIMDVCTGLFGLRKEVLHNLNLKSREFTIDAEIICKVHNTRKYRIAWIPVTYDKRSYGESKLSIIDGFKIAGCITRSRL
jgi:glycosyltransferase involved in cell wall biosynthesis